MEQNTREVENVNNIYHGNPALHQRIQQFGLAIGEDGKRCAKDELNSTAA